MKTERKRKEDEVEKDGRKIGEKGSKKEKRQLHLYGAWTLADVL
jgi:hypothetical protein